MSAWINVSWHCTMLASHHWFFDLLLLARGLSWDIYISHSQLSGMMLTLAVGAWLFCYPLGTCRCSLANFRVLFRDLQISFRCSLEILDLQVLFKDLYVLFGDLLKVCRLSGTLHRPSGTLQWPSDTFRFCLGSLKRDTFRYSLRTFRHPQELTHLHTLEHSSRNFQNLWVSEERP